MNILEEAVTLVRAIEARQVGRKENKLRLIGWLQRRLPFVPRFLATGADAKMGDVLIISCLWFVITFVPSRLVMPPGNLNGLTGTFCVLLGVVFVLSPVAFALPSIYGQCGVKPRELTSVTEHLASRGFVNAQEIELLWKSIKPFEDRSRTRVAATKWGIGILWASAIYILGKVVDIAEPARKDLLQYPMLSVGLFTAVVLTYALVWSYEAAIDRLFRTIEFGCNDYCLALKRKAPEATLHLTDAVADA